MYCVLVLVCVGVLVIVTVGVIVFSLCRCSTFCVGVCVGVV